MSIQSGGNVQNPVPSRRLPDQAGQVPGAKKSKMSRVQAHAQAQDVLKKLKKELAAAKDEYAQSQKQLKDMRALTSKTDSITKLMQKQMQVINKQDAAGGDPRAVALKQLNKLAAKYGIDIKDIMGTDDIKSADAKSISAKMATFETDVISPRRTAVLDLRRRGIVLTNMDYSKEGLAKLNMLIKKLPVLSPPASSYVHLVDMQKLPEANKLDAFIKSHNAFTALAKGMDYLARNGWDISKAWSDVDALKTLIGKAKSAQANYEKVLKELTEGGPLLNKYMDAFMAESAFLRQARKDTMNKLSDLLKESKAVNDQMNYFYSKMPDDVKSDAEIDGKVLAFMKERGLKIAGGHNEGTSIKLDSQTKAYLKKYNAPIPKTMAEWEKLKTEGWVYKTPGGDEYTSWTDISREKLPDTFPKPTLEYETTTHSYHEIKNNTSSLQSYLENKNHEIQLEMSDLSSRTSLATAGPEVASALMKQYYQSATDHLNKVA